MGRFSTILEGRHIIGIYPLLQNETCHLLAVDFDKQSWMEDALQRF